MLESDSLNFNFNLRWIQGVTLETILATTFGVKSETQTNPDDIMAKYAWEALNRSKWIGVIAMVPLIGSKLAKQLMPTTYGMGYGNLQSVTMRMIKQRKSQGVGDDHKEVSESSCIYRKPYFPGEGSFVRDKDASHRVCFNDRVPCVFIKKQLRLFGSHSKFSNSLTF